MQFWIIFAVVVVVVVAVIVLSVCLGPGNKCGWKNAPSSSSEGSAVATSSAAVLDSSDGADA